MRGLYELVVTCGYLVKHPVQATVFLDYHHVHEHKALTHLTGAGAKAEELLAPDKLATIEAEFQRVKPQYMVPDCEACKTQRLNGVLVRSPAAADREPPHPAV